MHILVDILMLIYKAIVPEKYRKTFSNSITNKVNELSYDEKNDEYDTFAVKIPKGRRKFYIIALILLIFTLSNELINYFSTEIHHEDNAFLPVAVFIVVFAFLIYSESVYKIEYDGSSFTYTSRLGKKYDYSYRDIESVRKVDRKYIIKLHNNKKISFKNYYIGAQNFVDRIPQYVFIIGNK